MDGLASLFQSFGPVLWLVLLLLVLLCLVLLMFQNMRISQMSGHYSLLTSNIDEGNLEQLLENHLAHLYQTSLKVDDLTAFCQELDHSVRRAVQRVGVVRFNPFNDTGGDQSFAIALLDAAGDGVVLSSLYSRNGNRIFAKSIENGQSKYPLTEEEHQAILQAVAVSEPE